MNDIVLKVDISTGKALSQLVVLDRALKKVETRQKDIVQNAGAAKKAVSQFDDPNNITNIFGKSGSKFDLFGRAGKNMQGFGKILKGFGAAFRPLLTYTKLAGVQFGLLTAVLGTVKLAMFTGQIVAQGFRLALQGVGMAAGGAVAGLATFLAATRELKNVRLSAMMGGVGKAGASTSGLLGSSQLGIFGGEALSGVMDQAASAGVAVNAQYRMLLSQLGNFALGSPGDPGKNLTGIAQAFLDMRKSGKVTLDTFNQMVQAAPVLGKAFGEFTGKKPEKAAEAGKTSSAAFIDALLSGQLKVTDAYEGLLTKANETLIGSAKGMFAQLKEQLTQLGMPLVDSLKTPLHLLRNNLSAFVSVIGPTLQSTFGGQLSGKLGGMLDFLTDKLMVWVIKGVPKLVGLGEKMLGWIGSIRLWYREIEPGLKKMADAWDKLFESILRPIGTGIWDVLKKFMSEFTEGVSDSDDKLTAFGASVNGLLETFEDLIEFSSDVHEVLLPIVTAFIDMAAALKPLISLLNKLMDIPILGDVMGVAGVGLLGGGLATKGLLKGAPLGRSARMGKTMSGFLTAMGMGTMNDTKTRFTRTESMFSKGGAKTFARVAAPFIAYAAGSAITDALTEETDVKGNTIGGIAAGAGAGAIAGATIGTAIFPGVGTGALAAGGAVIGGVAAGVSSFMGAKNAQKQEKETDDARKARIFEEVSTVRRGDSFADLAKRRRDIENKIADSKADYTIGGQKYGGQDLSERIGDLKGLEFDTSWAEHIGGGERVKDIQFLPFNVKDQKKILEAQKTMTKDKFSDYMERLRQAEIKRLEALQEEVAILPKAERALRRQTGVLAVNTSVVTDMFDISQDKLRAWAAESGFALEQNIFGLDQYMEMIGYTGDKAADAAIALKNFAEKMAEPFLRAQEELQIEEAVNASWNDVKALGGSGDSALFESTLNEFFLNKIPWMTKLMQDGTYGTLEAMIDGSDVAYVKGRMELQATGATAEQLKAFDEKSLGYREKAVGLANSPLERMPVDSVFAHAFTTDVNDIISSQNVGYANGQYSWEGTGASLEKLTESVNAAADARIGGDAVDLTQDQVAALLAGQINDASKDNSTRIYNAFVDGGTYAAHAMVMALNGETPPTKEEFDGLKYAGTEITPMPVTRGYAGPPVTNDHSVRTTTVSINAAEADAKEVARKVKLYLEAMARADAERT